MEYIIKRFIESLVTIFVIVSLVFLLMRLMPPEKYFTDDDLTALTVEQQHVILEKAGLLDPPLEQLVHYYKQLFIDHDFGVSRRIKVDVPVTEIIGGRFMYSVRFGVMGLIGSFLFGILFGIVQATHKDGILDHVGLGYTVISNAVPGLVVYTLLLIFGAKYLHLPTLYDVNDPIRSAIMPVFCLTYHGIASRMLWVRRYMVDELNKDYIKLATAKGLTNNQIMFRHVLRNAFVPLSADLPSAFLHTISGSLLVETFFSIPGMGALLTTAISYYDTNVVQTLVILYGFLGVMGVFLGDLTLTVFDPRVRLGKKGGTR